MAQRGLNLPAILGRRPASSEAKISGATPKGRSLGVISSILSDFLFLTLASLTASQAAGLWPGFLGQGLRSTPSFLATAIVFIGFAVIFLALSRASDSEKDTSSVSRFIRILGVVSFASMLSGLMGLIVGLGWYGPALGILVWLNAIFFLVVGGVITQQGLHALPRRRMGGARVLFLDDSDSIYSPAGNPPQNGSSN